MFTTPIKRTPLTTLEEVQKYSYLMNDLSSDTMTFCRNNGQIAFVDYQGHKYVTPFREEIPSILTRSGFEIGSIYVPFSNGGTIPESYEWLKKIALTENWAATHEMAYCIATERGITPVDLSFIDEKIHICEFYRYEDKENCFIYHHMTDLWLFNGEKNSIGTYIIIDNKTLIVCDEYGRTFLIKVKSVINDIVNALIDAGYRHNATPERYVSFYKPEEEPLEPELPVNAIL